MSTTMAKLLSPSIMYSVGWALLHFLWQGTALAAFAASVMALCRRASIRYLVSVAVLVLMLVTPLATLLYLRQNPGARGEVNPRPIALTWPAAGGVGPTLMDEGAINQPSATVEDAPQPFRFIAFRDALPWLVEAWLVGVAFFSLRSVGGFFLLERERRKKTAQLSSRLVDICRGLERRLGLRRAVAYCECHWLQTPAVIGWFRPVVFLPVTVLTGLSEEQLQSVIAHELAHIRRFDPFVNVFQVCVETLLFYHPAVWWLNKRIRAEREHCCDEMAVSVCGNALEYARALTLLEELRSAPILAMAANRGPLAERIMRVLGLNTFGDGMRGIGLMASVLCLSAALVTGNALLGVAHAAPQAPPAVLAAQAEIATRSDEQTPAAQSAPIKKLSAGQSEAREQTTVQTEEPPASASSYIDAMKAVGLGDLTVDQLIALKIQGVTPEYVREVQQQGLHPDVEKLIALRVQDVSPEYIRELRAEGLNPDLNQLIALKVQGVDAHYFRGIKEAGLQPDINKLIGMKVQDVTPSYVQELQASGLTPNADQVIALKVQDVTPVYLKDMHDLGIEIDVDRVIALRVQDVTPEYVRSMQGLGLKPSAHQLIAMHVQDVTPEYVKALLATGLKLDINEIIRAKIQDVTPEFVEEAFKHGFKDLSLEKLIRLRRLGILEPKAEL